jgi:S-adenosylmethionine-diacylglycerol 3-amino-3-carboxypropyl transferase
MRRPKSFSVISLQNAAFTSATRGLIYSQIWEDPVVDLEALCVESHHRLITIGSGGCNALTYLIADPAEVMVVDVNASQIALNRLKIAAMKFLPDYESFYDFFGAANKWSNVQLFDECISTNVDALTRTYWNSRDARGRRKIEQFARGFYRQGLTGRLFTLCHLYARLHRFDLRAMLHARDIDEQRDIYTKEMQPIIRARTTRSLASLRLLLFGLGIPPVQYDSLKGGRSMSLVLEERIERFACEFDLKENYFAWQFFDQGYASEGEGPLPIYLQRDNFDVIKSRVDRLDVHHTSYIDHLRTLPDHYLDRYVLLDAQDWMDDQTLTELWSEVTRTARPGSRVIFRTAGIDSVLPGRIPAHLLDRWSYHEETSMRLFTQDRSAVYGGFHLYTLKGAR